MFEAEALDVRMTNGNEKKNWKRNENCAYVIWKMTFRFPRSILFGIRRNIHTHTLTRPFFVFHSIVDCCNSASVWCYCHTVCILYGEIFQHLDFNTDRWRFSSFHVVYESEWQNSKREDKNCLKIHRLLRWCLNGKLNRDGYSSQLHSGFITSFHNEPCSARNVFISWKREIELWFHKLWSYSYNTHTHSLNYIMGINHNLYV